MSQLGALYGLHPAMFCQQQLTVVVVSRPNYQVLIVNLLIYVPRRDGRLSWLEHNDEICLEKMSATRCC